MGTDFIRATPSDLARACGGWREPLREPVRRQVVNPFTKVAQTISSWDPRPEEPIADYPSADLPGPSLEMDGFEKFGVDALLRLFFDEARAREQIAARERPPLIHLEDGPWLLDIPSALVSKLAQVAESELSELGQRWASLLRVERKNFDPASEDVLGEDFYVDALARLVPFAREAIAAGQQIYEFHSM